MKKNLSPSTIQRRHLCAAAALLLAGCASPVGKPPADAVAQLSGTGTLRAAINLGNPILASRGPDGQPRGVSVDLAREAARRLGLPIELVVFNSAGNVVEAVKAKQVDLAFVAIDPVRAADTEYTAPYVIIEGAYLAKRVSGVRMLPGRFMVIEQAMGVPKGRTAAQAWLTGFVEEMKASGFVADALQRHRIEGAAVAPRR
ncbi:MAG: transporter substrate-binding domain-containing protein [Comamonadaceae bacterium]|nr:MAG: transporter substrate-binding domain-containing protein [Comamonadaceae bacterium]